MMNMRLWTTVRDRMHVFFIHDLDSKQCKNLDERFVIETQPVKI